MLSSHPIKRGIEAALNRLGAAGCSSPKLQEAAADARLGRTPTLARAFVERVWPGPLREDTKWIAAFAFHFGYRGGCGLPVRAGLSPVANRSPRGCAPRSTAVIYGITFHAHWGRRRW
jgi:hypothetical protein